MKVANERLDVRVFTMTPFKLEIITQEKIALSEMVESLTIETMDGQITILAKHIPYLSVLKPGEIIVKKDRLEEIFAGTGGIIEVTPEKTVILADSAVRSEEIDEGRAEEARKKAEKLMEEKLSDRESAFVSAELEKALTHIRVAKRRKHK